MGLPDDLDTTLTEEDFQDNRHESPIFQDELVNSITDPDDRANLPSPHENFSPSAANLVKQEESHAHTANIPGSNSKEFDQLCDQFGSLKLNPNDDEITNCETPIINAMEEGSNVKEDPHLTQDLCIDTINNQAEGDESSQGNVSGDIESSNKGDDERPEVIDSEWWAMQYNLTEEGILLRQKQNQMAMMKDYMVRLRSKKDRLVSRLMAYAETGSLLKKDLTEVEELGAEESTCELSEEIKFLIDRKEHDLELMKNKYDIRMKLYVMSLSRASDALSPEELQQRHTAHAIMKNVIAKLQNQIRLAEGQLFCKDFRTNVINSCRSEVNYDILKEVTFTIEHKIVNFIADSIKKIDSRIILVRQDINAIEFAVLTLQRHFEMQMHCRLYAAEY